MRKNKLKKLISLGLLVLIILSSFQINAFAGWGSNGNTGECTFYLDSGNILTVSGSGKMADYSTRTINSVLTTTAEWGTYYDALQKCTINEGVTRIGDNTFIGCKKLTEITIPSTVVSISENAFTNSKIYNDATYENDAKYIGTCLISTNGDCTIKDGTTCIADGAFKNNKSVTNIVIPNTVKSIGKNTFKGCTNLESITLSKNLVSIDDSAFEGCTKLKSISIPYGATTIGQYAFSECTSLKDVDLPTSLLSIGRNAFYCCRALTAINIPSAVKEIEEQSFSGCSSLANLSMSDGLEVISKAAFSGCSIKNIVIPNSVKSIGGSAFSLCEFESLHLGKSVESIGAYAFFNETKLSSITVDSNNKTYHSKDNCLIETATNKLILGCKNSVIPNYVTSIGDNAFYCCRSLESITIPNGVITIGIGAFCNCTGLASITIGTGVTSIGNSAFYGCSGLASITIPNGVTSIGSYTFSSCTGITSITIPESVKTICNGAFYNCTGLKSIIIPDTVKILSGSQIFAKCTSLKTVKIGKGISQITLSTFEDCTSLETVELYSSVKEFCSDVFKNCGKLNKIIFHSSKTQWNKIIGYNYSPFDKITIYCTCDYEGHNYDNNCDTTCNDCGYIRAVGPHIYDNACDTTCNECGSIRTVGPHDYKTTWSNDATQHWHECNVCADKTDVENHVYDNDCDTTCNVCGATRTVGPHVYDNACDTTCNECGAVRIITHDYKTTWSKNGTQHWHECNVCGNKTDVANHVYDNDCDTTCNVCGATRTVGPHVYDNACDTTCNECGHIRTVGPHNYNKTTWSKDNTQHWHACSVCGDKTDVANHEYDNACDTTCNVCGYTRAVNPHVYDNDCDTTCNICGHVRAVMPHVYTNEQDTTCNICGHVRKVLSDASDASQWYYSAVNYCVENKYMNGYGGTSTFGVCDNIQRQDFVVILANYSGADLSSYNKSSKFKDVQSGTYFTAAVNWASANGIINGYADGRFGVGDAMTREQLVTMLYNFAKNYLKNDVSANGSKAYNMADYAQVSSWAKTPVEWAIDKGVIGGKSGVYIAPANNAQRCEIAQIIKNLDDKKILK